MTRRVSTRGLVIGGAAVGIVLLVLTLRAVDARAVLDGVNRVGAGFAWILALAALRIAARAAAWTECAGGAERLPVMATLAAGFVGEGVGNLTPLGLAGSEPAKVLWVHEHVGLQESAASLVVETLLYSLVVGLLLVVGAVAAMALSAPFVLVGALAASLVAAGAVALLLRAPPVRSAQRRVAARLQDRPTGRAIAAAVRRSGEILRVLRSQKPGTLALVIGLQLLFQAAAVVEVRLTLELLGQANATWAQAFFLECVDRAVTIAFKFVPLRLGVDEFASGAAAALLGGTGASGVALAVVRKARVLCLGVIGLGLLAGRTAILGARRGQPRS